MRHLLTFCTALAALAIPAAVGAHHQPDHQGGPEGGANNVTIDATSPIVWGSSTVISGDLRGPGDAGQTVDLQEDEFPFDDNDFRNVLTTTTNDRGEYRFADVAPTVNTRYRVVARTSPPVTSAVETVLVRIRVTRKVSDRTPKAGRRVRFSGTACPEHDGRVAKIQRRTRDGNWRRVKRTTLAADPGECSTYRTRVRIRRDGVYRVTVPSGDADHARGVSRRVRINAH